MAKSILGGIKELLLKNSELEKLRCTFPNNVRTDVYLQEAPDGLNLARGIVIVIEDVSNQTDRTTEAIMIESSVNVLFFGTDPDLLAERVLPLLWDIMQDEEEQLDVAMHDIYNLEIMTHRLMPVDSCDQYSNIIYLLSVECRIEHVRSRKGSQ